MNGDTEGADNKTETSDPAPSPALEYNTTARVNPQIIAAGVSPSLVNMSDDEFSIVALVRPGMSRISTVRFQDTKGNLLSPAMDRVGVLANGDEFYQTTFLYKPKGEETLSTAWGPEEGQFNIIALGKNNEESKTYPYLTIGSNYPPIENNESRQPETPLSYKTTKRYDPQVIMAGYSPSLLNKDDNHFDLIAIVRQGALPIKQVTLKREGDTFQAQMTLVGKLENGDEMYKFTYLFNAGDLGTPIGKKNVEIKNLWGPNAEQFGIEVKDAGGSPTHKFPDIEFGYYPEYKPVEKP
jgi:hypothetical protein